MQNEGTQESLYKPQLIDLNKVTRKPSDWSQVSHFNFLQHTTFQSTLWGTTTASKMAEYDAHATLGRLIEQKREEVQMMNLNYLEMDG